MIKDNKTIRVCHFTSAHNQLDDRIYLKECVSLKKNGYEVYIVARGESQVINGITIVGCGEPKNRRERMGTFARRVYKEALSLDCDIYHFHDPELLPYGVKLVHKGKKVIFDSHEDVPAQILDKTWLPGFVRKMVSTLYKKYETYAVKQLNGVITATEHIAEQFKERSKNIEVINNYPILTDIIYHDVPFKNRNRIICYAGGISEIRGEQVMMNSIRNTNAELHLAGPWKNKTEFADKKVFYYGNLSRKEVNDLYSKSMAGILLYQPAENHYESQPIKMFEYMAAGLPVICSDFELWKEIIEKNNCGICVNPNNIVEISNAINYIVENPQKAETMGRNGYKVVKEKYNWDVEEKRLYRFYDSISDYGIS